MKLLCFVWKRKCEKIIWQNKDKQIVLSLFKDALIKRAVALIMELHKDSNKKAKLSSDI